ncbi:MAG: RNA-binding protein [Rhodobacteraceae bacterium]|nr:RNA-binding protein [Paracoccaceae bacterium]
MTRGGRVREREAPERRCIVTGESQPKAGLVRFVADPEGRIVPDILGRLPGRGVYVSADRAALETAVGRNLFARALRQPVTVPEDLVAQVESGLVKRVTDLVSLDRKAGRAVAGFEKVKDWLARGEAVVLIQASDGSGRGKDKLSTPEGGHFVGCLTASEIGLSFGRDYAIHAALAAGGLTARVVEEAARLSGLRGLGGARRAPRERIRRTR